MILRISNIPFCWALLPLSAKIAAHTAPHPARHALQSPFGLRLRALGQNVVGRSTHAYVVMNFPSGSGGEEDEQL
jgi:hypothetical protein